MITIDGKEYWTVTDVAQAYNYTEYYVRLAARKGSRKGGLPGIKRGRLWLFDPAVVRKWALKDDNQ